MTGLPKTAFCKLKSSALWFLLVSFHVLISAFATRFGKQSASATESISKRSKILGSGDRLRAQFGTYPDNGFSTSADDLEGMGGLPEEANGWPGEADGLEGMQGLQGMNDPMYDAGMRAPMYGADMSDPMYGAGGDPNEGAFFKWMRKMNYFVPIISQTLVSTNEAVDHASELGGRAARGYNISKNVMNRKWNEAKAKKGEWNEAKAKKEAMKKATPKQGGLFGGSLQRKRQASPSNAHQANIQSTSTMLLGPHLKQKWPSQIQSTALKHLARTSPSNLRIGKRAKIPKETIHSI